MYIILILILIWDVIRNTESIITTKLITGNKIIHFRRSDEIIHFIFYSSKYYIFSSCLF
jgi:hypothetical protein